MRSLLPGRERIRGAATDLLCLVALTVACAVHLASLETVLDLPMWDEADYLRRGMQLSTFGLPDPEWGPLYVLWYHLGAKLTADPVELFYGSYRALVALPTLLVYGVSRRLGCGPLVALAAALVLLLSGAPHVIPRPTMLALLLVLAGVTIAAFVRSPGKALAVIGGALLLASYARPELFVSFALVSLALAVWGIRALRNREHRGRAVRIVGAYAAVALVSVALFGNPFGNTSNRRMYAFCQHFAVAYVERAGLDLDPWGQCERAVTAAFGEVDSVPGAALANPSEFLTHVFENLAGYPRASLRLFLTAWPGANPSGPLTSMGPSCLATLLLAVGGSVAWRSRAGLRRSLAEPRTVVVGVTALAVLAPSVLSAALIFPRDHYLVLQGVFVPLALAAIVAGSARRAEPTKETAAWRRWLEPAAAIGFVGALVVSGPPEPTGPLPHREVVRALDELHRERPLAATPVNVLEEAGGLDAYLGPRFRRVSPADRGRDESFEQFVSRLGIEAVVIDPALRAHHRFADDPEFAAFVRAPESFGFEVFELAPEVGTLAIGWNASRATGARMRKPGTPQL